MPIPCNHRMHWQLVAAGLILTFECFISHSSMVRGDEPLKAIRFEAETVTKPSDAWETDRFSNSKWNLWSTDRDADKKWSGGIVLQSPRVLADRNGSADGAPPLHTVIKTLPPGEYFVELGGVGRPIGISLDNKTWKKVDHSNRNLGLLTIGAGGFEIWVDDRFASEDNPGSCYYDYLQFTPLPDPKRKPKIQGFAQTRVTERLDRGVVAMKDPTGHVYVGWRLLKNDPKDVAFNVYRTADGSSRRKLNRSPLNNTTDFVDQQSVDSDTAKYCVAAIINGTEVREPPKVTDTVSVQSQGYLSVPLQGDYKFQKCGIADLNGDGTYDFVIKQPNGNVDPYINYWKPSPETYKIEAYLADGTFLWRYDLGWSIEQGIWYSPYIVHDLDGDGCAEVCLKAGEGDPRDEDGRVQSGPEHLLILDGMTGRERARVGWPRREDFPSYNYSSRNQMCVAYLDGKTPCLLVVRGTYNVIQVRAYQFTDNQLSELWRWNDAEEGVHYRGQGAHSMHAVDVDEDGRDEVFLGSAVLDDHGVGLWSTGFGHPDHHYVGDIDPARPGLEVYYGMETRQKKNGCCLADARTGEVLWGWDKPTRHVHSTGMCADIDGASPGLECYSSDTDKEKKTKDRWLFSSSGKVLRSDLDWGFGLRTVFWDANPQRELIRGRNILEYSGQVYRNAVQGSVVGVADVVGDWREEVIISVPGELRVYSTTIPAHYRRTCLMQDPLYRLDVCIQAMGYTQCPMTTN